MADLKLDSDPDATCMAIGRFIFQFSQLEYTIKMHAGTIAAVQTEYFNAVMVYDFALLLTVLKNVYAVNHKDKKSLDELKKIISECHELNSVRIRVVHGLWVPMLEGGTVHHVSKNTLVPTMTMNQARELETHAAKASDLRKRLDNLMWVLD